MAMTFKKILIKYLFSNKLMIITIIFMIILVSVLGLLPAQLLRIIVDDIIKNNKQSVLIWFALAYMLTYLFLGVCDFFKNWLLLRASQNFLCNLKIKMIKRIHQIQYETLVELDSGSLEAYFTNDVTAINELFTNGLIEILTNMLKMIGIVVSIFIYSYVFGGIVLLIIPILILFTAIIRKRMLVAQLKTKNLEGDVNKVLLETVENIEPVKIYRCNDYIKKRYQRILKNHFKANQASNFYDAIFSPIMQILRNAVVAVILITSGLNSSIFNMSVGMIVSAITLITDLFTPIESFTMEIQTIQKSLAAVKRIDGLFKLPIDDTKQNINLNGDLNIVFKNVSFGYKSEDVISNFSLTIKQNDKIAIQGPSGSGKSTLLKLALGILKPNSGEVLINNFPTYLMDDKMRIKYFQVIYQEPFFSGGSIYEELTFRNSAISKQKVYQALADVGLDYISNIDIKLNKSEYSSGELALFNIARILIFDSRVIFLDEMNAKIDPSSSKKIISLINKYSKDKIVISINHYGDTLNNAKIINLQR